MKASLRFWRRRTPRNSKTFILKCILEKSDLSTLETIKFFTSMLFRGFCYSELTNRTLGSSATSCRRHHKGKRPGCFVTFSAVAESPRQWLQPRLYGLVARPLIRSAETRYDQPGGFLSFQIVSVNVKGVRLPLLWTLLIPW